MPNRQSPIPKTVLEIVGSSGFAVDGPRYRGCCGSPSVASCPAIRMLVERLVAMPKQPFISIPLDIPDLQVLQTEQTKAGEFILSVESTLESTCCRRCGRTITEPHGTDQPRLLRHLPILGRAVYLRIRPKRFRCPFCDDHPTTTQLLDWYDPQALHTKAYERHL